MKIQTDPRRNRILKKLFLKSTTLNSEFFLKKENREKIGELEVATFPVIFLKTKSTFHPKEKIVKNEFGRFFVVHSDGAFILTSLFFSTV